MITNVPSGFCVHCMTTYTDATTIPICGHTFCGKCLCFHFLKIIEIQEKCFTCPECQLEVDWTDEEVIEWIKTFQSSTNDVVSNEVRPELSTEDEGQNETIFVNDEQNVDEISSDRNSNRQEDNTCYSNERGADIRSSTKDRDNKLDRCENINRDEEVKIGQKSSMNLEEEVTTNTNHTIDDTQEDMTGNVNNPTKDNSDTHEKDFQNTNNKAAEMYGQDMAQDGENLMKRSTHGKSDESGMDDIGSHNLPRYRSDNAGNILEYNNDTESDLSEEKIPQTTMERDDKKSTSCCKAVEDDPSIEGNEMANKSKMTPDQSIIDDETARSDHEEAKQNTYRHEEEMDTHDNEQGKDSLKEIPIQDANSREEEMDLRESGPDIETSNDQREFIQVTQNEEGTENTKTQIETNTGGTVAEYSHSAESAADHATLPQSTITTGNQIQTTPSRVEEGMDGDDSNYSTDTDEVDRNGNQVNIPRTSKVDIQENQNEEVNHMAEGKPSESSSLHIIPDKFLKVKDHSIVLSRKCSPTFTGLTLFEEDALVLCDNCGHNDACGYLCLFNFENNYITKMEMNKPFGVCALMKSESTVAVSVPNDKIIYLVSVCNDWLNIVKSFETKKEPLSLISLRNGQIGVTWKRPPSFEIVDISSQDMTQVRCYTRDSSGRRFKSFRCVAVDENRSHIIQPCHVDNAVYCFNFSGDPVFTYKDTRLRGPYGVDTDFQGHVYICSRLNDTIHIVSPTGIHLKIISEDIPSCPQTIRFDKSGDRVWMTAFDRYDLVFLYTIEKKPRSAECIAI